MHKIPLLSVCLIVKNASKYLEKCLTSVQSIADEFIIVDTGSDDNTLEIARRFTPKIYFFDWINDFAAARNYALSKASGDWILSISADEYLRPLTRGYIEQILHEQSVVAYSCKLRYTKDYTYETGNLYLFRNHPDIRFTGIIHENIAPSLEIFLASGKFNISSSELFFDHDGWDENVEMKYERDFKLLQKELQNNPENGMLWNRLALIYHHTDKKELAFSTSEKALALVRKSKTFHPIEANVYALAIQLGFENKRDMKNLVDEALDHYPKNPTIMYAKGRIHADENEFYEAISLFEQLLIMGITEDFDHGVAHPLNLFNELAYDGLAGCYFKLKRYPEAASFYEKALQFADKKEYRIKKDICLSLAKHSK